jgi:hypothetical protein
MPAQRQSAILYSFFLGLSLLETPRIGPATFIARYCFLHSAQSHWSSLRYGLYVAAVTSDSHTVMLEISAPLGVVRICFEVSS